LALDKITALKPPRGEVKVEGAWVQASIRFSDEEGAALLRSKPTDEARLDAFETAARIGLRSLASADSAYTERLLDEKLDKFVQQLNRAAEASLQKATEAFQERWTKRIDEELAGRLDDHRKVIDERLQTLFGESSDKSVQQAVRKFLAEYQATVVKEIGEDRSRLRRELTELLNGAGNPDHPITKISIQLAELRKDVAVELEAARAAGAAQQARKGTARAGFDYQAEVHAELVELLRGSDDEVELKGRSPGATGGAEGDMVVTVDPALTGGIATRIAVEATKQAGLSVAKLRTMLKKAKDDRAAAVAAVVIRDPVILGGQRIEFFNGLGVVVVFDPEDPEDYRSLPLLVALKHCRAVAVREVRPATAERNDEQIERASQKAKDGLEAIDAILGDQSKIVKLAEGTCSRAKELRRAVMDSLEEIDDALSGQA
jgi:hypothetical protein